MMDKLKQALQLSEAMLHAAEAQDWENLALKEQQRRALFDEAFADTRGHQYPQEISTSIQRILDIDKSIIELSRAGQQQLADKLRGFGRGRIAKSAYLNQP